MVANRMNPGSIRLGATSRRRGAFVPLAVLVGLLAIAACNGDKISRTEAKAAEAELTAKVAAVTADLAKERARIEALSAQMKAAEERAKKAEPAPAVAKTEQVQAAAKAPAAPTTKAVTTVKPADADTIRVHALADASQIADENTDMAPALKACDNDGKLGLSLCVLPKQTEYSKWLPVLVTWNKGTISSVSEARALLGCLQKQPAVKRDKDKADKNAAELALRSAYEGDCLSPPAK